MASDEKGDLRQLESAILERYMQFCQYGNKANTGQMDNKTFSKLVKDVHLINKTFTATDADLIFTRAKPKGGRKLEYGDFLKSLVFVSEKAFPALYKTSPQQALHKVYETIAASSGPHSTATKADFVKFHDDKSTFTGVYARGGPTNVDKDKITLSGLADRSAADARGLKK